MFDSNSPGDNVKILLVEGDSGSGQVVKSVLSKQSSVSYDISIVEDPAAAAKMLGEKNFDNVILDLNLAGTGFDSLRSIKQIEPNVPILVLSAMYDHDTAIESIRCGADDYLVKDGLLHKILGRSICFSIERRRRILESDHTKKLQNQINLLQNQVREIKDNLPDQISLGNHIEQSQTADTTRRFKDKFSPDTRFLARNGGAVRVEKIDNSHKKYGGKILVVEHDSFNRMLIGEHLKESGLEVCYAVSGLEAVEKSQTDDFDLILTAYQMPEPDGVGIVSKLRLDGFRSPVIVMTADRDPETIGKIKECGSTGHIFKPINKTALFELLDRHLAVEVAAK